MYQASQKFIEKLNTYGRQFRARLTVGDTQITSIKSLVQTSGSCGADTFAIGSVFASYIDVSFSNLDISLTGREMFLEIGLVLPDGTDEPPIEYIPMGYYTVQNPSSVTKERDQISINAVDRITTKCSGLYVPTVAFPCSIKTVLDDIASQAGVAIKCNLDTTGVIETAMDALTYRDTLGYIAGLLGGFCFADRDGNIKIAAYPTKSSETIGKDRFQGLSMSDTPYKVEMLTAVVSEGGTDADGNGVEGVSYSEGSGNGLTISNPYMTKALFDAMKSRVIGYSFYSGTASFLGNPCLDPEDAATMINYVDKEFFFPCMSITQDFDGGLTTTISTPGVASSDETVKGPTQRAVEQLLTDIVLAKEVIAKKITAEQADIKYATIEKTLILEAEIDKLSGIEAEFENVKTEQATITGKLTSQEAEIKKLQTKDADLEKALINKADITDLEAINTKTGTLEADLGAIKTLVNGNLTSDNIHSMVITGDKFTVQDGFVKNAMIESLQFDKITGIDINTTKLTVHSEDGKSTWKDNTIQIADTKRVRVQIGKDTAGDYNIYIWDKDGNLMFDPLYGVQASGIKQAIIRNDMVASDAAISGSKLDIDTVVQKINGSTTKLKSTTILLDDTEQTLDVAFKSLETTVGNNLETAKGYTDQKIKGVTEITESHETSLSVIKGQITTLISTDTEIKGDYDALVSKYNSTVQDVSSIKTTLNEHTTLINAQTKQIEAVETKANTIETDLSGTKQSVTEIKSDLAETNTKITEVETNLNGYKVTVSNTYAIKATSVEKVTVYYALSASSTTAPTTGWSETAPAWVNGKYMWQKTVTKYASGDTAESDPTNISGAKGATGAAGKDGNDFAWNLIPNSADLDDKQVAINATDVNTDRFAVTAGEKITVGFDIKATAAQTANTALLQYYNSAGERISYEWVNGAIATSYTRLAKTITVPSNTVKMSIGLRSTSTYANTYRQIKAERGTKATTWAPHPDDLEGAKGDKGDTGATGKGVKSIVTQYYLSSSNTTQTGGSWSTTSPTWKTGTYIWTRSYITWSDSTTSTTTPMLANVLNDTNTELSAVKNTVAQNTAAITVQDQKIELMVKETDITGNYLISKINLDATTAKIQAKNIQLEGLVTANSNFKILTDGSIEAVNGKFSGDITCNDEFILLNTESEVTGKIYIEKMSVGYFSYSDNGNSFNFGSAASYTDYMVISPETCLYVGSDTYISGNLAASSASLKKAYATEAYISDLKVEKLENLGGAEAYCSLTGSRIEFKSAKSSNYAYLIISGQEGITVNEGDVSIGGTLVKETLDSLNSKISHVGMIIHTTALSTMAQVIAVYGGTKWIKIEGRFLLGQSSLYALNTTGGESSHVLTNSEMPSHAHTFSYPAGLTNNAYGNEPNQYGLIMTGNQEKYNTTATGGSVAHNNMPPYKVVYIWERTA